MTESDTLLQSKRQISMNPLRFPGDVIRCSLSYLLAAAILFSAACSTIESRSGDADSTFVVAMIPDTQNMLDYRHQREAGFAIDASEQFVEQMQVIANWREDGRGDIAFVASVGDVWQHQSIIMDEDHIERGFIALDNPYLSAGLAISAATKDFEMPLARRGYQLLDDAGIPFGVAPGNHDYDAMWSAAGYPPDLSIAPEDFRLEPEVLGMIHIGGLNNFRKIFGEDSSFYKDRNWYVSSYGGGTSSAQRFDAGGYQFLHIALEMQPSDAVIQWALEVIDTHRGMPTIVSTHDYLNRQGERSAVAILDLARVDPDAHNSAQQLWEKLFSQRDEIFLVLCGHQHGQSRRVELNINGHEVYQILADFQDRGQSAIAAGQPLDPLRRQPVGVGDGWFRLLEFDLSASEPQLRVTTYSSFYQAYSDELPQYSEWYRAHEQPELSEQAFLDQEAFAIPLVDFRQRFGMPDQ